MGMLWTEEMEWHLEDYADSPGTWELMHEECGFEGPEGEEEEITETADLEAGQVHIHLSMG